MKIWKIKYLKNNNNNNNNLEIGNKFAEVEKSEKEDMNQRGN